MAQQLASCETTDIHFATSKEAATAFSECVFNGAILSQTHLQEAVKDLHPMPELLNLEGSSGRSSKAFLSILKDRKTPKQTNPFLPDPRD